MGGIVVGSASLVERNQTTSNVGGGISTARGCTVNGNTASFNTSGLVSGVGIFVDLGSSVFDNTARGNTVWGIWFAGTGGYGRNVLSGNNVCGLDTICP